MANVPYEIAQGKTLYISNPMLVAAIGGDNATPFYLNFPQLPPGLQWVFPYTYNFMYPVEPPQQLRVDASKVPRGYPAAPTSSEVALLTAWDTAQPYDAGTRAAASPPSTQAFVSGTLPAFGGSNTLLAIPCGGATTVGINLIGVIWATTTLSIEGTIDDVNWFPIPIYVMPAGSVASYSWVIGSGLAQGIIPQPSYSIAPCSGLSQVRINWTPGGTQGNTVSAALRATPGGEIPSPIGLHQAAYSVPVVFASDQKPVSYQNRVEFAATALTIATVAVEAMLTLVPVRAGVAGAGVTSIPVTAGKRLRITEFSGEFRNNAAAAHVNQFTLKTNPAGAAVVGSPTLNRIELYSPAALANAGQQQSVPFPDGIEFAGTDQIGVSHLSDAAAIGFGTVNLNGFEYTP